MTINFCNFGTPTALIQYNNLVINYAVHSELLDTVQDTMMLGADFYETDEERAALLAAGKVPMGIGENTKIRYTKIAKLETLITGFASVPMSNRKCG